jgi:hypothetical protein
LVQSAQRQSLHTTFVCKKKEGAEKHRANLRHALQLLSWVATNATVRREAEPMDEMTETDGSSTVSRDDEKIAVIAASYTEILKVTRNTSTSPTFLTS